MKEKSLVKSKKTNDISYGPEELKDLIIFDAVSKYKSVARAIRRGDVAKYGTIAPKRPFNNRVNTSRRADVNSRAMNEYKKNIYGRLTGKAI